MATTSTTNKTELSVLPTTPKILGGDIDYELFLDCVHCGLCTSACPTYVELGDENDSPRGRIYLMRAVRDQRIELTPEVKRHIDLCLDCRACETACPSGVQYSKLIEPFRNDIAKAQSSSDLGFIKRFLLFQVTPFNNRMRLALAPAKWMQWLGVDWLMRKSGMMKLLPSFFRQLHEMLPAKMSAHYGHLPEVLPAEGPQRARVALFVGCAGDAFYPSTTLATAKVLQKNGCEVVIPRNQVCCGALHYHAAQPNQAAKFAEKNCNVFLNEIAGEVDAIIVNAAGCGAMLKEYDHLMADQPFADQAQQIQSKVRDICEFLVELGPIPPTHPIKMQATYHDACHLCHAQQIRKQPRQLLGMIPELELLTLDESEICCGAAGSYNLTQPEMAERLGERKANRILSTGAQAVFTGNVGCLIQVSRYLRKENPKFVVCHPIDALWSSYSGEPLN